MRKRTHLWLARIGVLIAASIIILTVVTLITGCVTQQAQRQYEDRIAELESQLEDQPESPLEPSGIADTITGAVTDTVKGLGPDPRDQTPAQRSLWPFTWVGALTLAAGVVWAVLFRNPLMLLIGAGLAAVPFVVLYTSRSFLIPTSIGVGVIGLVWLGATVGKRLGIWTVERETDERAQFLRNAMVDGKVPPADMQLTGEVARALEWVGRPGWNPRAADLPHHTDDPTRVGILETHNQ